jgi:hypothetical protein
VESPANNRVRRCTQRAATNNKLDGSLRVLKDVHLRFWTKCPKIQLFTR